MSATDGTARSALTRARVSRLGDPDPDDLSDSTTPAERVEMVAVLTRRMWELTGKALPTYSRDRMPVRIVRPR